MLATVPLPTTSPLLTALYYDHPITSLALDKMLELDSFIVFFMGSILYFFLVIVSDENTGCLRMLRQSEFECKPKMSRNRT